MYNILAEGEVCVESAWHLNSTPLGMFWWGDLSMNALAIGQTSVKNVTLIFCGIKGLDAAKAFWGCGAAPDSPLAWWVCPFLGKQKF